jgi:hypothetical protein
LDAAMKALGKGSVASLVRTGLVDAWWALWFAAAAVPVVALVMAFNPSFLAGGHGHLVFGGADRGSLTVSVDDLAGWTWPLVAPAILIGLVAIAGSLMIVWRLRKLFDSFSSGEPFRRENANHLRAIWIIMTVIELSRYVLLALTGAVLGLFGGPEVHASYTFNIDLSTWGSILILIVLAEVFREGARLKEEQELTI